MFYDIYSILLQDGGLLDSYLGNICAEFVSVFLTLFFLLLPIVISVAIFWRALK